MTQAMINSIVLMILSTALGVITTAFWKTREAAVQKARALAEENKHLTSRVTEVESKLALVNQAVVPISTAFQAILIKELTHFHTPEMDALMVKLGPPNTLTAEEEERLAEMLKERSEGPDIPDSERNAAAILPTIIKRAKEECEVIDKAAQVQWGYVTVKDRRHRDDASMKFVTPREGEEPALTPAAEPSAAVAKSLVSIDKNTAATAESLAVLNQRAVNKLSTSTVKKAVEAEKEHEGR